MRRSWTLVLLPITLGLLVLTPPAFAIFGIGDVVYDPANYGQAVQQLIQLEQQYAQLVQTYQMARSQYEQMVRMAQRVPVNMAARYRAPVSAWKTSSANNAYGMTAGWINGINTGLGAAAGYSGATEPLAHYGAALSNIPADQLQRVKTNYATIELADGANLAAIETIGRLRANAPLVERAIQDLEEDSLSSAPNMNTEIAVLNKINAADVIAIRNTQDTNKLLTALAEQHIIDAKRKRDAEAQAINNHIRFVREGRAVLAAQAADASAAMRAWRMP